MCSIVCLSVLHCKKLPLWFIRLKFLIVKRTLQTQHKPLKLYVILINYLTLNATSKSALLNSKKKHNFSQCLPSARERNITASAKNCSIPDSFPFPAINCLWSPKFTVCLRSDEMKGPACERAIGRLGEWVNVRAKCPKWIGAGKLLAIQFNLQAHIANVNKGCSTPTT